MSQNFTLIWQAVHLAGSQKKLADALNVSPSTINKWVTLKAPIPKKHATAIQAWSNNVISAAKLVEGNPKKEAILTDNIKNNVKLSQIEELLYKANKLSVPINIYIGLDDLSYSELQH